MNFIARLSGYFCMLIVIVTTTPVHAGSAAGTTIATITRFLSITNVSELEFGAVSVSSAPGSVVIDTQGQRFSTGGVVINPNGAFTPAKFVIQGKPNASFSVSLPKIVELKDTAGNAIAVDNIQSSLESGRLGDEGALEITVGGQINLKANQSIGDYSGVLVVELNYS